MPLKPISFKLLRPKAKTNEWGGFFFIVGMGIMILVAPIMKSFVASFVGFVVMAIGLRKQSKS